MLAGLKLLKAIVNLINSTALRFKQRQVLKVKKALTLACFILFKLQTFCIKFIIILNFAQKSDTFL